MLILESEMLFTVILKKSAACDKVQNETDLQKSSLN